MSPTADVEVFRNLGTFEDEAAYHRSKGRVWLPSDLPQIPNRYGDPNVQVWETDLHGDTESDGLECALCMLRRLGGRLGDGSRHANYAENFLRYFRGDFRPADPALWATGNAWYRGSEQWVGSCTPGVSGFPDHGEGQRTRTLPCHFYVAGLFQAAMEYGDTAALAEGVEILIEVENYYMRRALDGSTNPIEAFGPGCPPTARGMFRQWKGAAWGYRATGDPRWRSLMNRIARIAFTGWVIRPGLWLNIHPTNTYPGYTYGASNIHHAIANDALWETRDLTDDAALKLQCEIALLGMADFMLLRGLKPETKLAPYQYHIKPPPLGQGFPPFAEMDIMYHGGVPSDPVLDTFSAYTTSCIHPLVRAYRMTGDRKYRDAAEWFWFNVSHHRIETPIGNGPDIPATEFGRFMDYKMDLSTSPFLYAKGESVLAHELIDALVRPGGTSPLDTFKGWLSVDDLLQPTERWVCDGWNNAGPKKTMRTPVGRSYSSAIIGKMVVNGKTLVYIWYFGGGDQSHQGDDVELLIIDPESMRWEQQYVPIVWPNYPATIGSPFGSPHGRVWPGHMYRRMCADNRGEGGRILVAGADALWAYDIQPKTWKRLTQGIPRPTQDLSTQMMVMTDEGALLFSGSVDDQDPTGAGGRHVYRYNDDGETGNGTFTPLASMTSEQGWSEHYPGYHAGKKYVLMLSHSPQIGPHWNVYDLATKTLKKIDGPKTNGAAISYDEKREVLIVAAFEKATGRTRMYSHDGLAGFVELPDVNPFPALQANFEGLPPSFYNAMGYDPIRDCHWMVWSRNIGASGRGGIMEGDVNLYGYRVPDGAAPPPVPVPTPPPTEIKMIATYLGRKKGTIAPATPQNGTPTSPSPVDNEFGRLSDLGGKRLREVEIRGVPEGLWHEPFNGTNWGVKVTQTGDVVDLQWATHTPASGPVSVFTVKAWFEDGTSASTPMVAGTVPVPEPTPTPPAGLTPEQAKAEAIVEAKKIADAALVEAKKYTDAAIAALRITKG